jgi:Sas10/Utp3/C1D family
MQIIKNNTMTEEENGNVPTIEQKQRIIILLSATLQEVNEKVQTSRLVNMQLHYHHDEFQPHHGHDFLDAKNSLLLSYVIYWTYYIRQHIMMMMDDNNPIIGTATTTTTTTTTACWDRLMEMKTAIDKMRGLDNKITISSR